MPHAASIADPASRVTASLVEVAQAVRWADLPDAARDATRAVLADHFACLAGGAATDWGQAGRRVALRWPHPGRASILGEPHGWAAPTAARVNAHDANMLDLDDTLRDVGHPGTCVIAAARAVAEEERASSTRFLEAVVAGYEVGGRFALAARPTDAAFRAVFPTAWHAIGAAVAAARVLGLDEEEMAAAIGVAAETAAGPTALASHVPYAFKSGKLGGEAEAGVRAAYAVAESLYGKSDALDPTVPYGRAFGSDRFRASFVLDALGTHYVVQDVSFKPYPACRFTHAALDAVLAARAAAGHGVEAGIDAVHVRTFSRALQLDEPEPRHAAHGPFCFPYLVAVAALGVPTSEWHTDATRGRTDVRALSRRVQLEADPAYDAEVEEAGLQPGTVTMRLADGGSVLREARHARGDPENPLPQAELDAKVRTFVDAACGPGAADDLLDRIANLEQGTLQDLVRPLTTDVQTPGAPGEEPS